MVALLHWVKSSRKGKHIFILKMHCLNLKIKIKKFTNGKLAKNKKQERLLSPFLTLSSNLQKKKASNTTKKLNINNGIVNNLKNEDEKSCSNCGSIILF